MVCLNRLWIWEVFIFINIFINLELEMEKNGILVFFVIVLVSRVLFVLGGFINSIFLGILVFIVVKRLVFLRKFIILVSFSLVCLIFVILLKVIWVWGFICILVFDFLKFIVWLLGLFWVWCSRKNSFINNRMGKNKLFNVLI